MRGLTIGQIFVLFEGLTQYITMTSPFGGGKSVDATSSTRESIGKDQPGAGIVLGGGALGAVRRISIDEVPDDIRDLLK